MNINNLQLSLHEKILKSILEDRGYIPYNYNIDIIKEALNNKYYFINHSCKEYLMMDFPKYLYREHILKNKFMEGIWRYNDIIEIIFIDN